MYLLEWGFLLDVGIGADDVLNLIWVGVLEREAAGSDKHPVSGLQTEPVHDGEDLTFQLHHLGGVRELLRKSEEVWW